MVKITKVYTRQGDDGKTSLADNQRIAKTDTRIHVIGEVDELNSSLGLALALLTRDEKITIKIRRIQNELFNLGAQLSFTNHPKSTPHIEQKNIDDLEAEIDIMNQSLPILHSFVLPGGTQAAAQLYIARAVCRRAERATIQFAKEKNLTNLEIKYLNRLSDWLFVTARFINYHQNCEEILWDATSRPSVED